MIFSAFASQHIGDLDFVATEGFNIIRRELFQNVGLANLAVSVIVLLTIGSLVTSLLITLNVAFCFVEILGLMYVMGIVIDSVSIIYMVLAIGLTVDYSAYVGHCFIMTKGGFDKNYRVRESLADIGSAVLSGATTTFLAVFVLLFSSSYVFNILAVMFGLSVGLGAHHGLQVMLSILGPPPFSSAECLDLGNNATITIFNAPEKSKSPKVKDGDEESAKSPRSAGDSESVANSTIATSRYVELYA